jgi:hypothetical protein
VIDAVAFKALVREGVGRVSVEEFSDTLMDRQVERALREFSDFLPFLQKQQLQLQAGVELYDAPEEVRCIIADSLSSPRGLQSYSFDTVVLGYGPMTPGSVPSQLTPGAGPETLAMDTFINQFTWERLEDVAPEREIQFFGGQFVVRPTPEFGSTVQMLVGVTHTTTTFPKRYDEELLLLTKAYVAMELANLRRKIRNLSSPGGVQLQLHDPAELEKLATEWREQFVVRAAAIQMPLLQG